MKSMILDKPFSDFWYIRSNYGNFIVTNITGDGPIKDAN